MRVRDWGVVLGGLAVACSAHPSSSGGGGAPVDCAPLDPNEVSAPMDLRCTGLYAGANGADLAPGVRAFEPGLSFWSDGAQKKRWVQLPDGKTIDTSNMGEWIFPVGTKVWKEFTVGGKKIETRFFWKESASAWVRATYVWSADGSSATRNDDGVPNADGNGWNIPSTKDCDKCHDGRKDKLLGFEAINLSLRSASGVTLDTLAAEGRLSEPPPANALAIPNDETGTARDALLWIHVNCGTSCHNGGVNAAANVTGLRLRLEPSQLARGDVRALDAYTTTIGITAVTPDYSGETRLVPGDPDHSLLVELASSRGQYQMPPIATTVVDDHGVALLRAWVSAMAHNPPPDAGPPDAPPDAPLDAPADAPLDAPLDAPNDAPHDAPIDAPHDAPADAPSDAGAG